jgi:hypothetical protein
MRWKNHLNRLGKVYEMIVLSIGQQGSGKTHSSVCELKKLASIRKKSLIFIHDLRCYYLAVQGVPYGSTPAGDGKGYIIPRSAGSLVPQGMWFKDPWEWWRITEISDEHCSKTVAGFHGCDQEAFFELGDWCFKYRQPSILFCDELDGLPKNIKYTSAWNCLQYGRRTPVDIIGTCRRPQELHPCWRSEASIVILHKLTEPLALETISKTGWFHNGLNAKELAEMLPNLDDGERIRIEVTKDITY